MIEFILILVLTVAVVMALSKGVGKPLQKYLQSNVIDIVGCMLRVGQFPIRSFGLCTEASKLKFDFNGSFSGVAGDGSSNGKNSGKNKDGKNSNNGGDTQNSSTANKNRPRFKSSRSTGSLNESDSDTSGESDTKTIKLPTDRDGGRNSSFGMNEFNGSDGETIIIRRIHKKNRLGGGFFLSDDTDSKQEAKEKALSKAVTKKPLPLDLLENSNTSSSFHIPKAKNRRPAGDDLDAEMDFSFFGILKWGLIIAILVIFGFFTLSQLNSIRKGWTD